MKPDNAASGRNGGQTSISQRLDAITEALGDVSAAIREDTHALIGDPEAEERARPYAVRLSVDYGGKTYRRVYYHMAGEDEGPREVAIKAEQFIATFYDDEDFYDETDEIPFQEAESITVEHVMTVDEEGFPVLLDREEWA